MPTPEDFRKLIDRLRRKLSQQEIAAINDIIATYRGIYNRVIGEVDALGLAMADKEALTTSAVVKMEQYRRLMATMEQEFQRFGTYTSVKLDAATTAAVQLGARDAKTMVYYASNGNQAIASAFRTMNPRVIENLTGFLAKDSPLYKKFEKFGDIYAKEVKDLIIEDVALGKNPVTIAKEIVAKGLGMPLTDAVRTMRTAQLWSYREANRQSYAANSEIVRGWVWNSVLDADTCAACWALHGSVHDLDETMDDHYNGHCFETPILWFQPDPTRTGLSMFDEMTDAEKLEMLGPAKYEAYKSGKITLSDLAVRHDDDTYGTMHVEASLKELLGE